MDKILHADDAVLAEVLLDDGVVRERDALLVDLAISTLVDELSDGLEIGIAVGDKRFHDLEHLGLKIWSMKRTLARKTTFTYGGLGQLDKNTVVDLKQPEQLQGLPLFGIDLVDTLNSDDEHKLGLGGDVEAALLLRDASEADLLALRIAVFLHVFLGTLEYGLALLFVGLVQSKLAPVSS